MIGGVAMKSSLSDPHYVYLEALLLLQPHTHSLDAIGGEKLSSLYPVSSTSKKPFQAPLTVLNEGRKKLTWLATNLLETEILASEQRKLSELYNSKMLEIVNKIRSKDVKLCSHLIGAFMEEQIIVPLKKTSIDTARALDATISTAAVGVWALFSIVPVSYTHLTLPTIYSV